MFSGRWRVISVQTDGESRRGAPEATDARSDQAEFCSRRAEWRTATFGFFFLFHSPVTRRYSVGGETKKEKKTNNHNPPPARPPRRLISSLSPNVKNTFVWLGCGQTASFLAPCLLCAAIQTLWAVLLLTWQQTNKQNSKKKKKNQNVSRA